MYSYRCSHAGVVLAVVTALPGCGGGTALILGTAGGDSGSGNPVTSNVLSEVVALQTREAPALLRFDLADAQAIPADVTIQFEVAGSPAESATMVAGEGPGGFRVTPHLESLATSPSGTTHFKLWDFAADLGNEGFRNNVSLKVRTGDTEKDLLFDMGIGNDPPILGNFQFPVGEQTGTVNLPFEVSDSSADIVAISVEFDDLRDSTGFLPVTFGTPLLAVEAAADGTEQQFSWVSEKELGAIETEVVLRFTPCDGVASGEPIVSPVLTIDNNGTPSVRISEVPILLHSDQRRGISVPFSLVDSESDPVTLVFQWTMETESFPSLPDNLGELHSILLDPSLRDSYQIASEYRLQYGGRLVPVDSSSDPSGSLAMLPELATSENGLLGLGTIGQDLEILRASHCPVDISSKWDTNPVSKPRAALPLGDGRTALVLDESLPGQWKLQEIRLSTGELIRTIVAMGAGFPSCMSPERMGKSVLIGIGTGVSEEWILYRVNLCDGAVSELIRSTDGPDKPRGELRSIQSLGSAAAVISTDQHLYDLTYIAGLAPFVTRIPIASGSLQEPWGLTLDPSRSRKRVYVADRAADQIVSVELGTRRVIPVASNGLPISAPQSLAFDHSGKQLMVVTDDPACPGLEIRGIAPGRFVDQDLDGSADAEVFELVRGLQGSQASLATGPDRLTIVSLPEANALAVGGGLEQVRRITAQGPVGPTVEVDPSFHPALLGKADPRLWRVRATISPLAGTPEGRKQVFVWDSSRDLDKGGRVLIRATPFDSERGTEGQTEFAKEILTDWDMPEIVSIGDASVTWGPNGVAVEDINADGALDIATANRFGNDLSLFLQDSVGGFPDLPQFTLGSTQSTEGPRDIQLADLDGDALVDVVSANSHSDSLTVFYQSETIGFSTLPDETLSTSMPPHMRDPVRLRCADLDGNGLLDVISVSPILGSSSGSLHIFYQETPREFADPISLPGAGKPNGLTTADFDRNGLLDIASADLLSHVHLWLQNAPRVFDPPVLLEGVGMQRPVSVIGADVTGDGLPDLAAAYEGDVLNGSEGGHLVFGQRDLTVFDQFGFASDDRPRAVNVGDFDRDGVSDLLFANRTPSELVLRESISNGTFGAPIVLKDSSLLQNPTEVTCADIDGDGCLEALSANADSNNITSVRRNRSSRFNTLETELGSTLLSFPADLDWDGLPDVVRDVFNASIGVQFQSGPGIFLPEPTVLSDPEGIVAEAYDSGDLNSDGILDVIVLDPGRKRLLLFFQTQPGEFLASGHSIRFSDDLGNFALGDLNADGRLDIAVSFSERTQAPLDLGGVVLQNDEGSFDDPVLTNTLPADAFVLVDDFLGDSGLEVAFLTESSVEVYELGQQNKILQVFSLPFVECSLVLWAMSKDLNRDGLVDIARTVLGSSSSATCMAAPGVEVYWQVSPGVFAPEPTSLKYRGMSSISAPRPFALRDIDSDGLPEVLVSELSPLDPHVFFQVAPGIFQHEVFPQPMSFGLPPVLFDMDRDGELDILASQDVVYGGH
jgi:hypothetical protein